MTVVVIDTSVIVKWVLPEPGAENALMLRSRYDLVAPTIWTAESANVLWRHVVRRELDADEAQGLLSDLISSPIATSAFDDDVAAALRLGGELSHPIYDCLYLALALRLDTHVVTADRRFAALAIRRDDLAGRVRLLTA